MKRVADYIIDFIYESGIDCVFMVTGGGAMYLNDAIKKHGKIKYVCVHHEQAAAIAAEGYFRASGKMACVCVTSGPGGLNCLTGVMGQWTDSVPVLYLSGQVNFDMTVSSVPEMKLRQLGDQEINIVDVVWPITKRARIIEHKKDIGYELKSDLATAKEGRFGPVWLDVPLNVQKDLF